MLLCTPSQPTNHDALLKTEALARQGRGHRINKYALCLIALWGRIILLPHGSILQPAYCRTNARGRLEVVNLVNLMGTKHVRRSTGPWKPAVAPKPRCVILRKTVLQHCFHDGVSQQHFSTESPLWNQALYRVPVPQLERLCSRGRRMYSSHIPSKGPY